MDEFPQSQETQAAEEFVVSQTRRWLVVAAVLLVAAALAFGYGYNQHSKASEMASQANEMSATIAELQNQVSTLNSRLSEMSAQQAASAPVAPGPVAPDAAAAAPTAPVHSAVIPKPRRVIAARKRTPVESPLKQLQARLDAQQKQLNATEDEVAKTRSDLEGNISSTRDELNGSIAKNHDELIELEKRGQRAYFEFDLTKSKQFQRSGPLMLSLRKADTKHKSYDLAMIIDDNQISKKHVDLYEPIWLHAGDDVQPVQVIVNQIDKDHVHGYISAPKYAESRQANADTAPGTAAPTAQTPAAPAPNVQ